MRYGLVRIRTCSDLEVDHAIDNEITDHEQRDPHHHGGQDERMMPDVAEIAGVDEGHHTEQHERHRRHEHSRQPPLGCQRAHLEPHLGTVAQQSGQAVQDLREVAAGLALDVDGDREERQILLSDTGVEVIDRGLLIQPEADFIEQDAELGADGIRHFARGQPERDTERMTGTQAADDDVERFGKLLAEAADAFRTGAPEQQVSERHGQDDRDRGRNQPRVQTQLQRQIKQHAQTGDPDRDAGGTQVQPGLHHQHVQPLQGRQARHEAEPPFAAKHLQHLDRAGELAAECQPPIDDLALRARTEHQHIKRLNREQRRPEHQNVDDQELVVDHGVTAPVRDRNRRPADRCRRVSGRPGTSA